MIPVKEIIAPGVKWREAIDFAVLKTKRNLTRHNLQFPHISNDKRYEWGENDDWIEGFWTGMVWLCYEYSGDEYLRLQAEAQMNSFDRRLQAKHALEHHDIGFLYGLSAMAGWIVQEDERHRALALRAADHLLGRWREAAGLIQAWGPEGDPENGGRIIIDCLMNLPLLYWASGTTGDPRYAEIAARHAKLSRKFLVRGDDSSYHTFYFDGSGNSLRGGRIRATATALPGHADRRGGSMDLLYLTAIRETWISWRHRNALPSISSSGYRRMGLSIGISMFL